MFTRESISKELKRIQDSIPPNLWKNKTSEVYKFPDLMKVSQEALNLPNKPEEEKKPIRFLLEKLKTQKKIVENHKIVKMIDDFLIREYKKSVKAGRLPTKKKLKELGLDKLEAIYEKIN
jgi:hypothetical protein